MKLRELSTAQLMLIAGTRVALGAGLGLLIAPRLADERRQRVGWALFLAGAFSTVPLAFNILGEAPQVVRHEITA